jgi:hypothetical protein
MQDGTASSSLPPPSENLGKIKLSLELGNDMKKQSGTSFHQDVMPGGSNVPQDGKKFFMVSIPLSRLMF